MSMADVRGQILEAFEAQLEVELDRDKALWEVADDVAAQLGRDAARWAAASVTWRKVAGDCIETADVTRMLDITRQAVAKRVKGGTLLGVPGRRTTLFPAWQFDEERRDIRPDVKYVLQLFRVEGGVDDPYLIIGWADTPQEELENLSPRQWIEQAKDDGPLKLAAERAAREISR